MSVLGKRTRSSAATAEFTQLPPSTRRRPNRSPRQKQHETSFEIHEDVQNSSHEDRMQIDEPHEPLADISNGKRDALSPTKANSARKEPASSEVSKRISQVVSPKTPRHRDALSKQQLVTPRHRVRLNGAPLTPRTPRTPQHQQSEGGSVRSVYQRAKHCFFATNSSESDADRLVGRKNERDELGNFISEHIDSAHGGALYVSGPPGTGKSALVGEVARTLSLPGHVRHAYLNCMSIKSANDLYAALLSELGISDDIFDSKAKQTLRTALTKGNNASTYLVILDEIDSLLDIDVNVLYNAFDWALHPTSRLVLVGIANALDLTDRFLPNLRARGLKPQLLPFLPYTSADIKSVLTARLRSLLPSNTGVPESFTPCLMPPAIQLISKKVAAQTGDLRKAFDIAQKAIDVIETETKEKLRREQQEQADNSPSKTPLGDNTNLSSPKSPPDTPTKQVKTLTASLRSLSAETAPRASISHVVRVTSAAFSNGTKERLLALNLQQKAVLCSLAALEQRNQRRESEEASLCDLLSQPRTGLLPSPTATPSKKRTKISPTTPSRRSEGTAPQIRQVYEAYTALCTRENMLSALSYSEFRDVVCNLETMGLVTAADGKAGSFVQVAATPSKRGRGASAINTTKMEERRVHGTAGLDELRASLDNAGAAKAMLVRMLEGRDL